MFVAVGQARLSGLTSGKAFLRFSKCCHDLACEILAFLGTDRILNAQETHWVRNLNAHSEPSTKIRWPFCKYCSEWISCGSSLSQQQNLKSAQEPLFTSVLLVLLYGSYHPTPGSIGLSFRSRKRVQAHQFDRGTSSSGSGASFAKMFSSLKMLMELMGIRHLTYLDAAINAARHV